MELSVGSPVELMGVENAGLDISGKKGTVSELPPSGLAYVTIDGSGEVISAWPENLKILLPPKASTMAIPTPTLS